MKQKIQNKTARIGVIGLGYVGFPLAKLLAEKGYTVTGFVRNPQILKSTFRITHIDSDELNEQDIYIVCVPTPVFNNKKPDLGAIRAVARRLSLVFLDGKLIINESTVAPGTTREEFGSLGGTYYLACSPERIDPGNHDKTVRNISKIVGGLNQESLSLTKLLYEKILEAPVIAVSSLEAAETVKMLENTYRAVNIALVNELARLCEKCGLDVIEIIEAAKSKWSFHAHYPSVGVGGHCIPVDPWYLVDYANKKGIDLKLVHNSLTENDDMAQFVADKVIANYEKGMSVLLYGVTYKKDVADIRESPVIRLGKILQKKNIAFTVFDPLVSRKEIEALGFTVGKPIKTDIFIIGTDHSQLASDSRKVIGEATVVIDGRNYFRRKVGKAVYGVGRNLL